MGQNYANAANAAAQTNSGLFGLGGSLLGGLGQGGFFNFFK
jgi:predicted lipid-binding transport protein (Tim44 family)